MKLPIIPALMLCSVVSSAQKINVNTEAAVAGVAGNASTTYKQYVTAGDRAYIVGTQNGKFPDMGEHLPDGMGGIWAPPYKLADGFWGEIKDIQTGKSARLIQSDNFINLPYGNVFSYHQAVQGINVRRFQFCPDTMPGTLFKYTFFNSAAKEKKIKFTLTVKSNLRPVWFTDILDKTYPDKILSRKDDPYLVIKDSAEPYYMAVASTIPPSIQIRGKMGAAPEETKSNGVYDNLVYEITLKPNVSCDILFSIAGTTAGAESSLTICKKMLAGYSKLLNEKIQRMNSINAMSAIDIPDKKLQTVYNWVKINTEWLRRTVPGIGTGLTAGYMEYPWWFGCDNTYSLQGSLATGNFELAKQTLELLYTKSKEVNNNGRIVHEITTSGKVVNMGNTQETAHFIMCAGTYLKWTGDKTFVKHLYPYMKQGIRWLIDTMDTNHDLFPEGYGITEITGLNAELIDVSVYTEQALEVMAETAATVDDKEMVEYYRAAATKLRQKLNREFYNSEAHSYCDFFGTRLQALQSIAGAFKQLKSEESTTRDTLTHEREDYYNKLKTNITALHDTSRGWLTNTNWVINTPMECGIAPYDTAIAALNHIRKFNCGEYGPYLSAVEKRKMMTIATGVQAVAECRYGRIDSAMWYIHRICATFGKILPGSISEMMPDYGCFTQEWTNYGIQVPLINYIFGVAPDAVNKAITLNPVMPAGWNYMNLKNLRVGDDVISVKINKSGSSMNYNLQQDNKLWTLTIHARGYTRYRLNGKELAVNGDSITLKGTENTLTLER